MNLSEEHRKFLLVEQCAIPTAINLVINAIIVWLSHLSKETVAIWGGGSVSVDLLLTSFLLPFIVCLAVTPGVKKKVKTGKLSPIPSSQLPIFMWYKRSLWQRAIFIAFLGVVFAGIPVIWILSISQAQPIPTMSFIIFKGFWAAAIASLITPIIGWWALANASQKY